jgi:sugar O-acyltransferase (sialic acid O-acetyltransferase NeuD family)
MSHEALPYWYIYGAGGLGLETIDILEDSMRAGTVPLHRPCFLEDATIRSDFMGYQVHDLSHAVPGSAVTIAVGEPRLRQLLMDKALTAGLALRSLISPRAFVSPMAQIGEGVVIAPLSSIQSRARIARNVAVNTMTIVGHDVCVKDGAVLSSMVNLGGAVEVGEYSYIGMGALVKEGISIGHWSIVSMGSVVFSDIPQAVIAVGNPARVSKRNENRQVFK